MGRPVPGRARPVPLSVLGPNLGPPGGLLRCAARAPFRPGSVPAPVRARRPSLGGPLPPALALGSVVRQGARPPLAASPSGLRPCLPLRPSRVGSPLGPLWALRALGGSAALAPPGRGGALGGFAAFLRSARPGRRCRGRVRCCSARPPVVVGGGGPCPRAWRAGAVVQRIAGCVSEIYMQTRLDSVSKIWYCRGTKCGGGRGIRIARLRPIYIAERPSRSRPPSRTAFLFA